MPWSARSRRRGCRSSPTRPGAISKASDLDLTIAALGAQGDGVAEHDGAPLFVPYTLPGDRVRARRIGPHHAVPLAWHARAAAHAVPACAHFTVCGGCALQHLDDAAYAAWKIERLVEALARRGLADVPIAPLRRTPPGARRRAEFAVARSGDTVAIGFHAYRSRQIVDLRVCPVLDPALVALLPALRPLLASLLGGGRAADLLLTRTESGLDMLIGRLPPHDRARREALAAFARAHDIARIACRRDGEAPETVVQARAPLVAFGGVTIEPPPGAFLQASASGERAIVEAVTAAVGAARHVADLFAGCGTLAFPLARGARVRAVEGAADSAAALDAAARRGGLGSRIAVETRDLARRPLLPDELAAFDAVVFDPPRDGAPDQAAALARSRVPLAVGVSCNPATFARDARTLVEGGYRLVAVTPIDQFLWTPHLELVGVFRR